MSKRKRTKLVHEGRYVAEVDVELLEDDTGWSPYLTPEDACKLDDVLRSVAVMFSRLPISHASLSCGRWRRGSA